MESRFQRFVLALALALSCSPTLATAQDEPDVLGDIVNPDLERRQIDEDKIDSETVELGIYAGVMSFEDFGSNDVYGLRAALHVSEDFFVEANVGVSKLQETSYERLSGDAVILTEDERDLTYYNLVLAYNILPGEIHIKSRAFYSGLYLLGGAGNTLVAENEYFTYLYGAGFRLAATDWLSLRFEVRNHVMSHSLFGEEKEIQNLEPQLGLTLFF